MIFFSFKKLLSKHLLLMLAFSSLLFTAKAQNYYDNGPLSTGTLTANGATTAPLGYTWSELQSVGGLTNDNLGFGAIYNNNLTTNLKIADDFTIPAGRSLQISRIDFYCYQTSYSGTTPPIDALRIEIWDGDPSLSTSNKIAGDMTTNRYNVANSGDAMMYRIGSNTPGTMRKLWRVSGNIATTLSPGTYWVVFQVHATNDGSIFFPTVTKLNAVTVAGANAKQYSGTAWAELVDAKSNQKMDFPFIINYHNYLSSLPVTFTNLQVKKQGDVAKLTWQTTSEQNNKEFVISRSTSTNGFVEISRQKGAGTNNTKLSYTYIDPKPIIGSSYYKLEQIDFDGTRTELKIAPFQFSLNTNLSVSSYPNPSKGTINLAIANLSATSLQVEITSLQGLKVHEERVSVDKELKNFSLNLKNTLAPGAYLITVKDNNGNVYAIKHLVS